MHMTQIECFLKVAELSSFSGAAKELYITQPTVSRLIRELETELGCGLFDRTNRNRITLTEAGRIYLETFTSVVSELNAAAQAARAVSGQARRSLRIGLPLEWPASDLVRDCEDRFLADMPAVRPVFEAGEFSALLSGLERGRYDLILCPQTAVRDPQRFEAVLIGRAPEIIVLSSKNPLAAKPELAPRDLRDEIMYVLPEEEAPLFRQIYRKGSLAMGYMQPTEDQPNRATIDLLLGTGRGCTMYDGWCRHASDPAFRCIRTGGDIPICAVFARDADDPALGLAVRLIKSWAENK